MFVGQSEMDYLRFWVTRASVQSKRTKKDGGNNTSTQLRRNSPQNEYKIPQCHNDTPHPQQWLVYLHTQIMQTRWKTLIPLRKKPQPCKL